MTDILPQEKRSWNMSRIRSQHTKPELIIRSLLHRAGFRFRINNKELPGSPDIVLPKYKAAIFIHGCFWHRHENCAKAKIPNSNQDYWQKKFVRNAARDAEACQVLERLRWRVVVLWECEILKDPLAVCAAVIRELQGETRQTHAVDLNRRQILKIAEKKSSSYLNSG